MRDEANYRAWREATKEKRAERARENRADNPEIFRATVAAYRERNLEKEKLRCRKYMKTVRLSDPDKHREKLRTWFKLNRGKARTYEAKQRAVRNGVEGNYTAEDIELILEAQQGLCFYCGVRLDGSKHEDHFIALSKGGTNYRSNIVLSCSNCNLKKGNKAPVEFMNWKLKLPEFWKDRN